MAPVQRAHFLIQNRNNVGNFWFYYMFLDYNIWGVEIVEITFKVVCDIEYRSVVGVRFSETLDLF